MKRQAKTQTPNRGDNAQNLPAERIEAQPELMPTAPQPEKGMIDVAQTRAAQEVQAGMVMAKRFPRDEQQAYARIMQACKRHKLAEQAIYTYPRGGTNVTGPSIRLAEVLAQAWGNMDAGIIELSRTLGSSEVMAYAWDLETNMRQTKVFTVPHERRVGKGEDFRVVHLTDPRDIYEMTANQGSRRLRACILGVIPGDIQDAAVEACRQTRKQLSAGEPLIDRIRKCVAAFHELGVTGDMIAAHVGHPVEQINETELDTLRGVYQAINDGMAKTGDYFGTAKTSSKADAVGSRASQLAAKLSAPVLQPPVAPESGAVHASAKTIAYLLKAKKENPELYAEVCGRQGIGADVKPEDMEPESAEQIADDFAESKGLL